MNSAPTTRRLPRLAALDGLRFVAAGAVMLFHYTAAEKLLWGNPSRLEFPTMNLLTRYGYLGVQLFFVISGFVILMTAYGRRVQDFVASRVSRLFPAYWVAVVGTFLLQSFWHGDRESTALQALVNLTMLQGALGVPGVQGAFWTLWVELKFYLLIGLFVVVGMTRQRVIAFALLWPLLAKIADATDSAVLVSLLMPSHAPYFAAGMLMYVAHRHGHNLLVWLGIGVNYVLCVLQAVKYARDRSPEITGTEMSGVVVAALVTAMFAAVLLCSNGWLSRIEWRWLTAVGALTYPVYLVHGQLGFFVIDVLHAGRNSYLVLAAAMVASFAVAWLIHTGVEKPFARPLRVAINRSLTDQVDLHEPGERTGPEPTSVEVAVPRARPERPTGSPREGLVRDE
ncbi:acyltransferase [Microlunatus lacustris]